MTNDRVVNNWEILGICWFAYVGCYLMRLGTSALMPFLKESLQLSNAEVGWLISVTSIGYIVAALLGWLVDVKGVRRMMLGGQILACIFGTSMAGANSFGLALVFLGIVGAGYGFMAIATTKAILLWFQAKRRAMAMGFKQTAFNAGGILAAATMPAIALALGLSASFLIVGLVSLASVLLTFFLYKDPPRTVFETPKSPQQLRQLWLKVIKRRNFWLATLAGACLISVEYTMLAHLTVYLTEITLLSVVVAGLCLAVAQGSGIAGKPLSGLVSDTVLNARRKPMLILASCIAAAGCGVFAYMPIGVGVWFPIILCGIVGLAVFGWAGVGYTLIAEISDISEAGTTISFAILMQKFIAIFAPPFLGAVVDKTGSYFLFWLILSGVAAVAVILTSFIRESSINRGEV